ncbi:Uncharacterised protein [Mycolicibacterium flavescens]|nr:Uncharacterised protein [Mycolicibacterium flavescens]
MVFQGRRYRTAKAWQAAFNEFLAARGAWAAEHEGVVLKPIEVNGSCPLDWSRFRKS